MDTSVAGCLLASGYEVVDGCIAAILKMCVLVCLMLSDKNEMKCLRRIDDTVLPESS
jgi:hypothetical protein